MERRPVHTFPYAQYHVHYVIDQIFSGPFSGQVDNLRPSNNTLFYVVVSSNVHSL